MEKFKKNKYIWVFPFLLILIGFLIYNSSLKNGFIENWDDNEYIIDNQLIKNQNLYNVTRILTENYMGHYHPVTMLSLSVDYALSELNPYIYHLTSLLIHLINGLLIFYFFSRLINHRTGAFLISVVFLIHPMHIESVAWISSRKDLLFTMFYFLSLIFYLRYIKSEKWKFLLFSLLFFMISVLSKSQAVVLPFIFILTDWFMKRKWSSKLIWEKSVFFLISIIFSITAIYAQEAPVENAPEFSILNRIFLVLSAVSFYMLKFIIPVNLSVIHFYPDLADGFFPWYYYLSFIVLVISFLFIYRLKHLNRLVIFGSLFFIVNLLPVIQIFPIGESYVAERYSYVAYCGLTVLFIWPIISTTVKKQIKYVYCGFVFIALTFYIIQSVSYLKSWSNGMSLFENVIQKYPDQPFPYFNRGLLFLDNQEYEKSIKDFDKAMSLGFRHTKIFFARGTAKYFLKDFKGSVNDLTNAIKIDSACYESYYNRGLSYANMGSYRKALTDFNQCLFLSPEINEIYFDMANAKYALGLYTEAIRDFDHMLNIFPDNSDSYYMRGMCKYKIQNYNEACSDWKMAMKLNNNLAKQAYQHNCLAR